MELTLQKILLVEDDPTLLNFRCTHTGILLWPQIRIVFLRMILSDLVYHTSLVGAMKGDIPVWKAVRTLGRSLVHNAWMRIASSCRADVCIMAEGVGNQFVDGIWFNRSADYFVATCLSRSLVVEDHNNWQWAWPRYAGKILFHAPLQARNTISSRLLVRRRHMQQAEELVCLVCRRAEEYLNWEAGTQRKRQLIDMLARKTAALPLQHHVYKKMLKRVAPKVMLVYGGCYGPLSALIIAAREMGIVTAEYQHGAVSSGHDGYNIAPCLKSDKDYRATLPDYFLSYGTWWGEQINVPVIKIAVGNPHRDAQLERLARRDISNDAVLVLGDGVETEKYLNFAGEIAKGLNTKGLRVIFRPHPWERARVETVNRQLLQGVDIDREPDIYQSLMSAYAVVGEVSTGLFEAIGLADNVFIWYTPKAQLCYPEHPFQVFSSATELVNKLTAAGSAQGPDQLSSDVWENGWRQNYTRFLRSHNVNCT